MFTLTWTIREENVKVREFLRMKGISKAALTDIKFKGGRIAVDGAEVTVRHVLQQGELLQISFPPEQRSEGMEGEELPLHIVYEDEHVLVMNKQPYMATIPSREHRNGTVAHAILHHYDQQQLPNTVHIVTRLDRDTSGLMLVAKHRFVHHLLSQQQKEKTVHRTYVALVHGVVHEDEGTIEAPIGRKTDSIIERVVCEEGQHAVTHFRVIARMQDYTYVELRLETGRTHQIRVHMAHIGHPLLGDDLYGGTHTNIKRQALHSSSLSFYHPLLEKEMAFSVVLPDDMNALVEKRCRD